MLTRKRLFIILAIIVSNIYIIQLYYQRQNQEAETGSVSQITRPGTTSERLPDGKTISPSPSIAIKQATGSALVEGVPQYAQTFNNCGPATLSMIMTWAGTPKDQHELGKLMRPYQNPQGDNDDKSINSEEFVSWAQSFDLYALRRPNGTHDLIKTFVSNGIPVVVKSWLHPNEDIGHFRIIKGYDDSSQVFIQDDSYDGPNLTLSYTDFNAMLQPFNYEFFIVVPKEKTALVNAILGANADEKTAWQNAIKRADSELQNDPNAVYPVFNKSLALYYLENYEETVTLFEQVESRLPRRMLWYQIEPIRAYAKLGNAQRVFDLSSSILNNQNRGFSELYILRGDMYIKQGLSSQAAQEYDLAVFYNTNLKEAQDARNSVQ